MSYSLQRITTIQDCDLLLDSGNTEKSELEFRILSLQRQKVSYSTNSFEVSTELQLVQNQLAGVNSVLTVLPDGNDKDAATIKKVKYELQLLVLNQRQKSYGNLALIDKELDLARAESQMASIDDYLTQVTARKAELSA
jgi:hypothetical protein